MNLKTTKHHGVFWSWFICSLGAIFYCYEYLLRVSPSVMSHQLMETYHLSGTAFGHLSAMYYYIYVPMQLLVGLLLDRYGPRRLLTFATLSCCIGIYLFASSHFLIMAQLGRFLMGFGSAFAFVGALKLATIWLPPTRFGLISGIALALGMIGGILGDIFLTFLVDHLGWRPTCLWAAAFGVGLMVVIYAVVRDKNGDVNYHEKPVQLHTAKLAWPELWTIFRNPQIWINGAIGCLLFMSLSTFAELWQIPYLKQGLGYSSELAAQGSSMVFLGWAIGGPIVGWLSDFLRRRVVLMTVGSVVSAILISMVLYLPNIPVNWIMVIFFVSGLFSCSQILIFPVSREISPPSLTGTALAISNMFVMLGGLFVPVVGIVLDRLWDGAMVNGAPVYSLANYQVALSLLPIGLLLAALLSLFLRETYCKQLED